MTKIKKICLVGATGTLGSALLPALAASTFELTVLQRNNSSSTFPSYPDLTIIPVDPDFPLPELESKLKGFDAVIAAFPLPGHLQNHLRLAAAAAAAGVKKFIPADFGSCDAADPEPLKRLQLYRDKVKVREKCEELSREYEGFGWTALIAGHFFDWGLKDGLLHFDLEKKEALILDGGDIPASASTLSRIGEAVVKVLEKPDETANKTLYIQSVLATQNEVLASLEKATKEKWTVNHAESGLFLEKHQKSASEGDGHAVEEVVFALGAINADWSKRDGFAMELLGLKDESLDEIVQRVVDEYTKA